VTYQPREFAAGTTKAKSARPTSFVPRKGKRLKAPVISVVVPVKDEENGIRPFVERVSDILTAVSEGSWEILFVDDGSTDETIAAIAAAHFRDPRVRALSLSRNFGKEAAISAGLEHARGEAVVPMDVDMQDPPEVLVEMVAKWREGYEMVFGVRRNRDSDSVSKRLTANLFYRAHNWISNDKIPENAGDFRLLDRKVLDVINEMPERHRFMKGIFAWPGFKVASIEFQANRRAHETASRWSFFKLWRFALDGLFSFSTAPLKLWTYIGVLAAGGGFVYLLVTLIQKLFFGIAVPGYASLLIVVLFFSGLLLISNGIQGEYIARIFEEVKGRPLFVVGKTFGFDAPADAETAAPTAEPAKPARRELPKPTKPPALPRS
jgi:glycosyltransferase involved in cell wall biosynthesis